MVFQQSSLCDSLGNLGQKMTNGSKNDPFFQKRPRDAPTKGSTLETTQGQIDGLLSQLSFKCYLQEVECV